MELLLERIVRKIVRTKRGVLKERYRSDQKGYRITYKDGKPFERKMTPQEILNRKNAAKKSAKIRKKPRFGGKIRTKI